MLLLRLFRLFHFNISLCQYLKPMLVSTSLQHLHLSSYHASRCCSSIFNQMNLECKGNQAKLKMYVK